ncbi:clan AA aspartic protease, TIGR02281 family [Sulfuricella denitrificans skB26]|uniref:Clan AA aspartic protease, TIGR02281 family n=2 Tax=Sulfuricella denitrificans TaxID=649841 RepID=S6AEX3_SULDS|nr:clan AA aspartic protease, TIGR02281 family [Sulfuricella denitrificans skB26]
MNTGRFPWGHITALVLWLILFGAMYLFLDAKMQPQVATVTGLDMARGEVIIQRSRDGHYYVGGSINGRPLTFMVDTGASTVVVSADLAAKIGLARGVPTPFKTAGGMVLGEMMSDQTIEAGGIQLKGLRVGVVMQMDQRDYALLGQNFLRYIDVIQSGDQMVLKIKSASEIN